MAFDFDCSEYKKQQLQDAQIRETTILSVIAWGNWLVAGLSSGHLVLWDNLSTIHSSSKNSKLKLALHTTIYDLKIFNNLLLCGTDSGLIVYNWEQLVDAALNGSQEVAPLFSLPMSRLGSSTRATTTLPECNSLAVDLESGSVWTAAGDGIAYSVDLNAMKIGLHTNTLGIANSLYSVCVASSASTVFVGGESGYATGFDRRSCEVVSNMEVIKSKAGWISSLVVDDNGQWLTCAGGHDNGTGHVSLWHTDTNTALCRAEAPAPIHDITYHEEALVSVGGESFVTYWDVHPSSGDSGLTAKGRTAASPTSLFKVLPVSLNGQKIRDANSKNALVVAGDAPLVDFYMTPSSKTLSLLV
mmetsp:Transcript_17311/g.20377  ORF Transcript_17311/g.20377 Transcript_17311/m.20377 type:complete len:358 (-) Transcript_17311:194-1267(-)